MRKKFKIPIIVALIVVGIALIVVGIPLVYVYFFTSAGGLHYQDIQVFFQQFECPRVLNPSIYCVYNYPLVYYKTGDVTVTGKLVKFTYKPEAAENYDENYYNNPKSARQHLLDVVISDGKNSTIRGSLSTKGELYPDITNFLSSIQPGDTISITGPVYVIGVPPCPLRSSCVDAGAIIPIHSINDSSASNVYLPWTG